MRYENLIDESVYLSDFGNVSLTKALSDILEAKDSQIEILEKNLSILDYELKNFKFGHYSLVDYDRLGKDRQQVSLS